MSWHPGEILSVVAAVIAVIFYFARLENRLYNLENDRKEMKESLRRVHKGLDSIYYQFFGKSLPEPEDD